MPVSLNPRMRCAHPPWVATSIRLVLALGLLAKVAVAAENTSRLWEQFVEAKRTGAEPVLADFSYAGYHAGDRDIPDVKAEVFDVTRYGAVPDDEKSDRAAIIEAIAAAEKNGSGIVHFPKGRFLVNEESDPHNQPIFIKSSHIVLRGAGSGAGGTELFMARHMDPANPKQLWTSPFMFQFVGKGKTGKQEAVTADARRQTHGVTVAEASAFEAGQWVVLTLENNSPEVVAAAVAPYKVDPAWSSLVEKGVRIQEFHRIESVQGGRVVFKTPLNSNIKVAEGWNLQRIAPLQEVGVEDIAFTGNWQDEFVHHQDAIHNGGWSMLAFTNCANGWVRRCRFTNTNRVLAVNRSAAITVEDLVLEGKRGHNAVTLEGSSHCLVQRVQDRASHWHAGGVTGPSSGNVFLDCAYPADTCYESHAAQPRWNLFDNISGGWMYGRWGGAAFNQPNHLHGLVFWNYRNIGAGEPGKFHFMRPDDIYGRIIMPYVIGFHGNPQEWVTEEIAVLESNGRPVKPESLYRAQLELRLGKFK